MDSSVLSLLLCFIGTVLVCFICLVACFMLYLHYVHMCNAHLPGPPRSSFIFGNLSDIWEYKKSTGKAVTEYITEKRLEYGPIFLLTFVHRCVVFLADPGFVREVFVNHNKYLCKPSFVYEKMGFIFGQRGIGYGIVANIDDISWRKRRRIMNPAFHRQCLKDFITNFNNVCNRFLIHMGKVADSSKVVSMVDEFGKATLEAISQVSFNIDTNAIEDPESPFPSAIRTTLKGVQANFDIPMPATFLGIFQFKLFQNESQKVQINAARFLRKFASDCIAARMKDIAENKDVPNDLLNLLITDGSLSMDEMIDEFLTIFIAGQETTASSLAFTLYEILTNPNVEVKLLNEIDEVLGENEDVQYDHLSKLKYIGQVLEENLRLHPIAPTPTRILLKEIMVGGYRIPKGTGVASNSHLFAMNPEIWQNPDVFDPERFADAVNIPNLAMMHFPFSVGPRNCIGQTFAKFESKVMLAKLFQKFQFKLLPNQTGQMIGRMTMTPKDGVMCKVERRTVSYNEE